MEIIIERQPKPIRGIVRVRSLPDDIDTDEKYIAYWKRLTSREREKFTIWEGENLITTGGNLAINNFLGNTSTIAGFAKYLALGIGALTGPAVGDTSLVNEVWRKIPSLLTVVGNTSDISTSLLATDAQAVLTEAGLYTGSASATLNSGTLSSHILFPLVNNVGLARSVDYLIVRN